MSVIRTEHGWYDGEVYGHIIQIEEYKCIVRSVDDWTYDIDYVRDIRPG